MKNSSAVMNMTLQQKEIRFVFLILVKVRGKIFSYQILQNASMFNRQVIQLEHQIQGLQGLRARTNPESTHVVEDVEKLVRALRDLKSRLAAECEELEALRREKLQRADSYKQRLKDAASSEATVRERVQAKKTEIEQLRAEVSEVGNLTNRPACL